MLMQIKQVVSLQEYYSSEPKYYDCDSTASRRLKNSMCTTNYFLMWELSPFAVTCITRLKQIALIPYLLELKGGEGTRNIRAEKRGNNFKTNMFRFQQRLEKKAIIKHQAIPLKYLNSCLRRLAYNGA